MKVFIHKIIREIIFFPAEDVLDTLERCLTAPLPNGAALIATCGPGEATLRRLTERMGFGYGQGLGSLEKLMFD